METTDGLGQEQLITQENIEPPTDATAAEVSEVEAKSEAINPPASETVKIPDKIYFRIGDVAEIVGVKPYVLRYWESEFPIISPEKSTTGQRVYKRTDVETLLLIKHLLYTERYSIEGARKRIRQLRKHGEFHSFKRETVLGGEEALARKQRIQEIARLAQEVNQLVKIPIHDIFRN